MSEAAKIVFSFSTFFISCEKQFYHLYCKLYLFKFFVSAAGEGMRYERTNYRRKAQHKATNHSRFIHHRIVIHTTIEREKRRKHWKKREIKMYTQHTTE